ncbi:fatty acid desaturase family protein [Hymenobacter crusticola]|uniref:Fatty acid desaturase n=1 Tax=Hymenobacter crusticola TaxID=1770526 RepID=A0A243WIM8_9BACT|nr:fatty acid desaturase [Hymenobacter crusticola]OUJ75412.1 fatty acid desaturase [Hymenobacter crusticola]
MKYLLPLTDPEYRTGSPLSWLDRQLLPFCQDPRDLPFLYLTLRISLVLIPLAALLFVPAVTGWLWAGIVVIYLGLSNFYFKGPFGLMLHCTCHRILFKKKYALLNKYIPWIIGPLFGQTPESYFTHHMGMHHPENNLPDDESSTMFYQRDSWVSFLRYLGGFFLLGIPRLFLYFIRTNKKTLLLRAVRGEGLYIVLCLGLLLVNWQATLIVFVLPVVLSRIVMMLGNWSQHAFVAAASPDNCYTNSITCINTRYNHKCWNDGYHISHHLKPAMHWSEHPRSFRENINHYSANDAIVFDGIHFLHVFVYLMTKRYDLLAKNFVNLGNRYSNDSEVIALLRSRTQRINRQAYA